MAIARGAGTEIIRTIQLNEVDDTWQNLIFGVQHHIYTVLSIIIHANSLQAAGNHIRCRTLSYDALAGETGYATYIFQQDMQDFQTYVWNDKFSMNGHEPVDFTATLDSIVKQDAIADQGSAVVQKLQIRGENASDDFDVHCTYIDQNNA